MKQNYRGDSPDQASRLIIQMYTYLGSLKLKTFLIALIGLLVWNTPLLAQDRQITGKVLDPAGVGIPGVGIYVKGTTVGTITDAEGAYQIKASEGATLVFQSVGFITQEVVLGASSSLEVTLAEDIQTLNEVIVVGYGVQQKKDLTGSVSSINVKDFNKGTITSPQELLVGRISGVSVISGDGSPGAGAQIKIRGGSSLSASNNPLVVIDGVVVSDEGISGVRNPLSLINPNDIENVTVLKDASATAIYGARATNGVILITTKRGKEGAKPQINYNAQFSIGTLPDQLEVFSAAQHRAYLQERVDAEQLPSAALDLLGDANTNWQDMIFRNSFNTDHNVAVSGAILKKTPFRVSLGYTKNEGILMNTNFERLTTSIGIDPSFFKDQLKLQLNFKGNLTKNTFTNEGAIGSAVTFDPTQPVRSGEDDLWGGYFFWPQSNDASLPNNIAPRNPLALLEQTDNNADVNRIITNAKIDYSPAQLKGLTATLNVALDRTTTDGLEVVSEEAAFERLIIEGEEVLGRRNKYDAEYKNELLETYLTYTKKLTSIKSDITLLGGYSYQRFFRETSSRVTDFSGGFERTPFDAQGSENFLISFYGRLNYTFNDKYLLTVTVRRDGSSRFVGDNQWGTFPSVALAWRVADENFLKNVKFISDLKLRAGWGLTGQENIGQPYPALSRITFSNEFALYQFGLNNFLTLARLNAFDANLKWEETSTYNIGLDYGFWKGRISGSIDYFFKETTDLLNNIPIPIGTNFSNRIDTNVGSLENEGVEFNINAIIIDKQDWNLSLGYNITAIRNEITKLTAVDDPNFIGVLTGGISGGVGSNIQIHQVGQPASSFFVYEQIYDEQGAPIQGLYVDQNQDGIINDNDRVIYNDPAPDVFMGFSGSLAYKNLSLGFNARANVGNFAYNNVESAQGFVQNVYNAQGWLSNAGAFASRTNFNNAQFLSDFYIQDASFFRMDNITLAYRFDKLFTERVNASLSFTVQNAFIITKYDGLDPELTNGIDNNLYPRPRTFVLGLNVNFK
ncbi:MAG: TonB-dependent receptor [Microscillaceae bacterium]|nr:TonB-dependent receptor [Microscillaceae bacterium]